MGRAGRQTLPLCGSSQLPGALPGVRHRAICALLFARVDHLGLVSFD